MPVDSKPLSQFFESIDLSFFCSGAVSIDINLEQPDKTAAGF